MSHAPNYDRAYFDHWYRDPARRVFTPAERSRRVALAVAAAEYVLDRRLKTVLDVGAGEGHWRAPLRALRPRVRYLGYDPSTYVVRRFGANRNIRLGDIESLLHDRVRGPFDLVLAVGFLNLLRPNALARALQILRPLVGGVALLELFCSDDTLTGDIRAYHLARARTYRRLIAAAGFVPLGLHLYTTATVAENCAVLERAAAEPAHQHAAVVAAGYASDRENSATERNPALHLDLTPKLVSLLRPVNKRAADVQAAQRCHSPESICASRGPTRTTRLKPCT